MMPSLPPKVSQGFTLMEILVVLVLVSLISGLLMEGFGSVLRLRFNVTQQVKRQNIQQLQEYWFRNLVTGIIVNTKQEKALFQGSDTQLQAQSVNTLNAPTGVPRKFLLKLETQTDTIILKYSDNDKMEWSLGEWNGQNASFSYLDYEGHWVSDWPPKMGIEVQQLPQAIQLQIDDNAKPIAWIVAIPSEKNPKPSIEEFL